MHLPFSIKNEQHPVGLQLFTFFDIIDADVQGTLKQIADIGYKEIESAFSKQGGCYGMHPKAFADYLNSVELKWYRNMLWGTIKIAVRYCG